MVTMAGCDGVVIASTATPTSATTTPTAVQQPSLRPLAPSRGRRRRQSECDVPGFDHPYPRTTPREPVQPATQPSGSRNACRPRRYYLLRGVIIVPLALKHDSAVRNDRCNDFA